MNTTQVAAPTQAAAMPSAAASAPDPGSVYVDANDSQASGAFVRALADVTASTCGVDGADGGTVGLAQVNVDGVAAGASGDFSAPMPYTGEDALSCVLRVERRVAG